MLHLALLGIRTSLKQDLKYTTAELVYGTSLCLPGEFFTSCTVSNMDPASYVMELKHTMQNLRCTPTRKPSQWRSHIDNTLNEASHLA